MYLTVLGKNKKGLNLWVNRNCIYSHQKFDFFVIVEQLKMEDVYTIDFFSMDVFDKSSIQSIQKNKKQTKSYSYKINMQMIAS